MISVKLRRSSIALMAVASILLVSFSPVISAAAKVTVPTGGNGLRVSPVRADATLTPGQTQTLQISVTNVTSSTSTLQAVVNDFTASKDETGQPAILLGADKFAPNHSLKRYVKSIPNFTLKPSEQQSIPVTISIPADAPGGGYYGAVRFAPASLSGGKDQNVTLAGSVGTLILIKVTGDVKEQLNIDSFDVRHNDNPSSFFFSNRKLDAVVRFQNGGNIQEQPFGKILLKNRSGAVIAQYEVNSIDPRGNVLPDSIRKFNVPLTKVGSFGKYKLEGNFGYGSKGQLLSASTTFYVIPIIAIIFFIFIVLLLLFVIFGLPRMVASYNRRVISRSRR